MGRVERGWCRSIALALACAAAGGFAATSAAQDAPAAPGIESAQVAPEPGARPAPRPATPAKPAEVPKPTERAWVHGELRVNYRVAASPTATPLGVLTTGDEVGVIERRGGWARILVGESSVGWLPESDLDPEPPPREHVTMLEEQVKAVQKSLDESQQEADSLRGQVAQLTGKDAERDEELRRLRDENRDLQAGERWPYMVMGAGILAIGFVVGLLFRGGSRRSSRLRY